MKKAPYRNALRSKQLIHDAFIKLLMEKEIVKIKTCEVIEQANISKGTFYVHYTCLYDVQQEIENEQISLMFEVFDQYPPELMLEDFLPLFLCGLRVMEKNRELFRVLFRSSYGDSFLNKVKRTFLEHMLSCSIDSSPLKNHKHARSYLMYVAGGSIAMIQEWLEYMPHVPAEIAARFLSDCALNGMRGLKSQDSFEQYAEHIAK